MQIRQNKAARVIMAMSGGVDSSVSALLLKQAGYEVIGLYMKNWEEYDENGICTSQEDYNDVAAVCSKINIPFLSVNFSKEYQELVFKDFIEAYKKGLTPNPDILCNKEIKFNVLFQKALELGGDYLATGHYAQTDGKKLFKGLDENKDQTYFLAAIDPTCLSKILFPIGHLPKNEVKLIAEKYQLVTKNKKESMGICFIGKKNMPDFLSKYLEQKPGPFVDVHGKIVGQHIGAQFYTMGQRKGLGLGGEGPRWFVYEKDMNKNIVYVTRGEQSPLQYDKLIADSVHWLDKPKDTAVFCKLRHRQKDVPCVIKEIDGSKIEVSFLSPERAIAPGQYIVFYKDSLVLGSAQILKAF